MSIVSVSELRERASLAGEAAVDEEERLLHVRQPAFDPVTSSAYQRAYVRVMQQQPGTHVDSALYAQMDWFIYCFHACDSAVDTLVDVLAALYADTPYYATDYAQAMRETRECDARLAARVALLPDIVVTAVMRACQDSGARDQLRLVQRMRVINTGDRRRGDDVVSLEGHMASLARE